MTEVIYYCNSRYTDLFQASEGAIFGDDGYLLVVLCELALAVAQADFHGEESSVDAAVGEALM